MPVAALPGNVRLRSWNMGKETTFGTPVTVTRRFGWRMTAPSPVDPHWTFPDTDTGTLPQALAPYQMRNDYVPTTEGPLAYNDAPYLWAAITKSGVTPSSNVWTFSSAATSQDSFEIFTAEWGDETADVYRFISCVGNRLQLVYPEDLGPVVATMDWLGSKIARPGAYSASLQVDPVPTWVYAADTQLYLNDSAGAIATTALSNSVHGMQVEINANLDRKSFANGSNTRFQTAGYGRGLRENTTTITFAKSTAALAEIANWLNASPVERFLSIKTVAPDIVTGSTHYAHELRFAGFWFTQSNGTYGTSNTTNQLVCQGFLDQTLGYDFQAAVTCGLSAL